MDFLPDKNDEDYEASPSKRRSTRNKTPKKHTQRPIEPVNFGNDEYEFREASPLRTTWKPSVTPQKRLQRALKPNIHGLEDELMESDDENDQSFVRDEESEEEDCDVYDTTDDTVVSKASKSSKTVRGKVPVDLELFDEQPPVSVFTYTIIVHRINELGNTDINFQVAKIQLLCRSISKLQLEVMQEDATRRAELQRKVCQHF